MGKKYKYSIGDWVTFKRHYKVSSSDNQRYAYEIGMSKPILGQICGAIVRYVGKIVTEQWDYHNEYGKLITEKSIILYQIKTGMINIAYEAKEEDIEPATVYDKYEAGIEKLPWKETCLSKSMRNLMSEYAADRIRNEKGHFL
jgi:hypothetical protein